MNKASNEPEKGGKIGNRQGIYAKFEPHAQKAIDTLVLAMEKGNWAVKIGASKAILAKLVPDLKAIEPNEQGDGPLIIKIVNEEYP